MLVGRFLDPAPKGLTTVLPVVPISTQLSKYELIEEIGHGGMATVFRARDRRLDREVAVKLIHRHLRESEEVAARFNSEAKAVAKLRHPNIVEVFDVSEPDDVERYLIVELIRGVTLRDLLKENGALPVELAAEIVVELTSALEHAHAQNVIHRDVKPENVLIELPPPGTRDSADDVDRARVKLTDFGIAKLLDAQGVTSTGQVLGSPAHMAPEQIEGKVVDRRADVFSLGVLFYECVVGALPFAGNNPAQVLRNVLDGNFEPPVKARPCVGSRISEIIVRALQREPEDRFDSIEDMQKALRAELKRLGFEHPRRDITDYLRAQGEYVKAFPERIVEALVKDGVKARAERNMSLATAQFNRALSYKPGDPELLTLVSGMRRRRSVQQGLLMGAALLGCAGAAYGVVSIWPEPEPLQEHAAPQPRDIPSQPALVTPPLEQASKPQVPAAVARPVAPKPKATARRKTPKGAPPVDEEPQTRDVSVRVTGAPGGSVRIDGTERPWFGVTHQLSLGEHLFEFVPPDDTCCIAGKRSVAIVEGEGPQLVVGRIAFKDAGLRVGSASSRGWSLSCPSLFAGDLKLPGERSVSMSQLSVEGSCTLSNSEEGSSTRGKVVTLRAGNTTVLPWP